MLDECRAHYKDNPSALRQIEEFDRTYQSNEALKFYTNDSFVYRLFNRAMRTENIDVLFLFRFFLIDMYYHLQRLHWQQFLFNRTYGDKSFTVYRGQQMKMTEFDHIKENIGHLISVSTFFSTTKNFNMAMIYSGATKSHMELNMLSVIFEIEISLTHDASKRPFASLEHLSKFPEEEEVLFSVGSTFHIIDIQDRQGSDKYWHVKMVLVEDDRDISELRKEYEKKYSQGGMCDLANVLIEMGDYDRAERYCRMMLEYLPEWNTYIGSLKTALGIVHERKGDPQTALKFYQESLKFYTNIDHQDSLNNEIGKAYVHIGQSYRSLGQLDLALENCMMAADIQSPTGSLSFTYNEIALIYRAKGDKKLALKYFFKSLYIEEHVLELSQYHPKLATTYNNIGEIFFLRVMMKMLRIIYGMHWIYGSKAPYPHTPILLRFITI